MKELIKRTFIINIYLSGVVLNFNVSISLK